MRAKRIVYLVNDGTFFIDPYSHFGYTISRDGGYEEDLCAAIKQYLQPGGVFADIGANEGFFSVVGASCVGPKGRVIVVEPQSRLQSVIKENLRLNRIENAVVLHAAVSDRKGTATMHLSPDINTGFSGLERGTRYSVPTEEVRTLTLADVLAEADVKEVHVLKMDIEGFEDDAILGAPDLFRKGKVRVLALELHQEVLAKRGRDPEKVIHFLKDCGYVSTEMLGPDHRSQYFFVREDLLQKVSPKRGTTCCA